MAHLTTIFFKSFRKALIPANGTRALLIQLAKSATASRNSQLSCSKQVSQYWNDQECTPRKPALPESFWAAFSTIDLLIFTSARSGGGPRSEKAFGGASLAFECFVWRTFATGSPVFEKVFSGRRAHPASLSFRKHTAPLKSPCTDF